jgi:hypothetical protein
MADTWMLTGHHNSGKFSNYCTNCTTLQPMGEAKHLLICSCEPLVGSRGPVESTLNLGKLYRLSLPSSFTCLLSPPYQCC